MSNAPFARSASWRPRSLLALLALAVPLAGCATVDRTVPTGTIPDDFHLRHQVVLTNAPTHLDIFPVGPTGRLDGRQRRDVEVFAADYIAHGQGGILIEVPHGAAPGASDQTVYAVRRVLAASGVRDGVRIGAYPVSEPALAAPLHMSFLKLQARGSSHCGDWPDDLNSGASLHTWENHTYYNLGCGTTQTLAAQVDDPRDLLRGRAEDPTDVQLRTRAIGQLRVGKDPSTTWTGNPSVIGPVGGF